MKATTMAIFGGLLKGAGSGITADYEDRRQMALANLKREWDLQDAERTTAAATAKDERDFAQAKELVDYGAEADIRKGKATAEETRLTQAATEKIKFENDKKLEVLKSNLNMTETQARIAAELSADLTKEGKTVDHWDITSDGRLIGVSKTGQVIAKSVNPGSFNPSNAPKGEEGEEGGTISAAQGRRGGAEKKPAAQAVAETSVDANRARTLYANATPETAPRLFRNGTKIPYDEFERLMKGGQ